MRKLKLISVILSAIIFTACGSESIKSERLEPASWHESQIPQYKTEVKKYFEQEIVSTADFSVELFKKSYAESKGENTLISPLSVLLALAMTANGADGDTLFEMEAVLGDGKEIEHLNAFLFSYVKNLYSGDSSKLGIANSIWFRDSENFTVEEAFLQTNKSYYDADIFKSAFDISTVTDINNWVKENTGGLIKEIIDEIPPLAVMYLINAIIFDAEWQRTYYEHQVRNRDFYAYDGQTQTAKMMYSSEWQFIKDELATGFIKPYKGNHYSFAALLPNEGVNIDDYVTSLTGTGLLDTLSNVQGEEVRTGLPKFSFDYDLSMNDVLESMGIEQAFCPDNADFSKLGQVEDDNIYISRVIHKTYIEVDELGTKAGAVTMVEAPGSGSSLDEPKEVILDRPFVFLIIDNKANLPVFIGVVNEL